MLCKQGINPRRAVSVVIVCGSQAFSREPKNPLGRVVLNGYFCSKSEDSSNFEFTINAYPKVRLQARQRWKRSCIPVELRWRTLTGDDVGRGSCVGDGYAVFVYEAATLGGGAKRQPRA